MSTKRDYSGSAPLGGAQVGGLEDHLGVLAHQLTVLWCRSPGLVVQVSLLVRVGKVHIWGQKEARDVEQNGMPEDAILLTV